MVAGTAAAAALDAPAVRFDQPVGLNDHLGNDVEAAGRRVLDATIDEIEKGGA